MCVKIQPFIFGKKCFENGTIFRLGNFRKYASDLRINRFRRRNYIWNSIARFYDFRFEFFSVISSVCGFAFESLRFFPEIVTGHFSHAHNIFLCTVFVQWTSIPGACITLSLMSKGVLHDGRAALFTQCNKQLHSNCTFQDSRYGECHAPRFSFKFIHIM